MIALLDYRMGNLFSVSKALEKLHADVRITDDPSELERFDGVLLPGVGNFGDGMEQLNRSGLTAAIRSFAASGKPLMGICLGMQMLLDSSEEAPGATGIGLIPGSVVRFQSTEEKIPHMGWNTVSWTRAHWGNADIGDNAYFYFVHSYYARVADPRHMLGSTDYINRFASVIARDNIFGTQCHPEKSQDAGLTTLKNFIRACETK